jgi:hypothetical protein
MDQQNGGLVKVVLQFILDGIVLVTILHTAATANVENMFKFIKTGISYKNKTSVSEFIHHRYGAMTWWFSQSGSYWHSYSRSGNKLGVRLSRSSKSSHD